MTIRCKKCHAVVWVQPSDRSAGSGSASCRECGQEYVLRGYGTADGGEPALAGRARQTAKEHGLDLPSAYTVLLGLATADEMREFGDAGSTVCRTARSPGSAPREHNEGFQTAIDAGLLTVRQAAERGSRETFAAILASRHGLARNVALDVADNRISLLQAIRLRAKTEEKRRIEVRGRRLRTMALVGVLLVVTLAAWLGRDREESAPAWVAVDRALGGADVRTGSGGEILQVAGPDPRSVLRAFCAAAGGGARLQPLDVVPTSLPGARARVGLLRDPRRPDELLSITIREDRDSGRWIASEDGRPLVAEPAPTGAEGAVRPH